MRGARYNKCVTDLETDHRSKTGILARALSFNSEHIGEIDEISYYSL